ncbi:aspartate aminotransferase family protein [Francisella sp. SYW-9]|uniref:aspartate aminotransferase family protein n=1 Tax=Francisella sp. SYW-9 TaxID=2610888 RepID=UPI00123C857C|nr:aspartate aminotransferase family protein [Francisella sp. SYW-9]
MLNNQELQSLRKKYVPDAVFQLTDLNIVKAKGAKIWDSEGNEYIDFVGAIGCVNAGHNPDSVVNAIKEQADNYLHIGINITNYEPYIKLTKKLVEIMPGDNEKQAVLFNSGAEAVENAIKIARYAKKRQGIVCFNGGYHGRTLLTMSLTTKIKPYKLGYGPFAPEVYHVPHPEISSIQNFDAYWENIFNTVVAADNIAAIIFEPVLGEGGFIPMPKDFVQKLRKLCTDNDIVLIADEIQSGFCRTGEMFAIENYGITPDLMTIGKSIASGLPLTAVVGSKNLINASHVGGLGGTFCGNPLACQAALESIKIYESDNLSAKANDIGEKVRSFFSKMQKKYNCISDIRGLGAMIGIEFCNSNNENGSDILKSIITLSLKNGVVLMSAGLEGNVLRTLMPLVISNEELDKAFKIIEQAFKTHFNY